MIFWSLCAFIWLKNMKKMLLQTTSGFLQLESTLAYFYPQIIGQVLSNNNVLDHNYSRSLYSYTFVRFLNN
jgi:hypothetical protein